MRSVIILTALTVGLTACHKPVDPELPMPSEPGVNYIDLRDFEIPFNKSKLVDLNGDQQADFNFQVLFTGDNINKQDNFYFQITPKYQNLLLSDLQDQSPMLHLNESVKDQFPGFGWQSQTPVILAEKNLHENGRITWRGPWTHCSHKFVGVQLKKDNLNYFGWVELSLDGAMNTLVLHRAGISKEPGKEIHTGR